MTPRQGVLLVFALSLAAPCAPALAQDIVVTGDPFRQPPVVSGSELARRSVRSARSDEQPVIIRRRCSQGGDARARPTGEVHVGASSVGERQIGATFCTPLGDRGDIVLGGDVTKSEPNQAPRRPVRP